MRHAIAIGSMLSFTDTAMNAPRPEISAARVFPVEARAAPVSASSRPSACIGSAMKLLAYTQSGVVKPSSSAASNAATAPAPRARAAA